MRSYFGTDGIRGLVNQPPMTTEVAMRLGKAAAHYFGRGRGQQRPRFLIGKDPRLSGYMFEAALAAGINAMGGDVLYTGPLPTPGIARLTTGMRCAAGFVISASHNPYHDNGIKIFGADGFKLPDEEEERLEQLMDDPALDGFVATDGQIGRSKRIDDAAGRYIVFLKMLFPRELSLQGLKVVVDCANGAAYKTAPSVLWELGADVITTGCEPNGTNINADCGALHPEHCARLVVEHGANLGVTLDGDADRLILIDERGEIVDGDHLLAMTAVELKARGRLRNDKLVATVMSNLGLDLALRSHGIEVMRSRVGDRYVVELMREHDCVLGGEQSGHLVFLDHSTTGDGMIGALEVMAAMQRTGRSLSELSRVMERLPQVLLNVAVREKPPLEQLATVAQRIATIEGELAGSGRVLVRYSGTEPKCRVMVEGPDQARITELANDIANELRQSIGATA